MIFRPKKLNLGCGSVFVDAPEWLNLDFAAVPGVQKANLLDRLPLPDDSTELVYSSHFLEHIPRSQVSGFLRECLRVLQPGGVIRLVLPDLENMARIYLQMRAELKHNQADFLVLEIVDQCVRNHSGGSLGKYYEKIREQAKNSELNTDQKTLMIDFIRQRTGENIGDSVNAKSVVVEVCSAVTHIKRLLRSVPFQLQRYWIQVVLSVLPPAFREQNVSLAEVGERHHWLWDFHQLQEALGEAGFISIERRSVNRSTIEDFPFFPLDLDSDGKMRKGEESMYVEAIKPRLLCL